MARIYWLQGFPEQASACADESVELALEARHSTGVDNVRFLSHIHVEQELGRLVQAEGARPSRQGRWSQPWERERSLAAR